MPTLHFSCVRAVGRLVLTGMLATCAGCGLFAENLDRTAKTAGRAVTYYCENVTIPEIRDELRAKVNAESAPHTVTIVCRAEVSPE